jgi:alpha,alpha-trehalose phosphorylase
MDLADIAGNVSDGIHVASSAGVWMSLVFGFGGVRDYDGALAIDPRLPHRWRSLSIPILFQDRQLRITLTHDEERYTLEDGAPLKVNVRGESRTLTVDAPLVLAAGSRP